MGRWRQRTKIAPSKTTTSADNVRPVFLMVAVCGEAWEVAITQEKAIFFTNKWKIVINYLKYLSLYTKMVSEKLKVLGDWWRLIGWYTGQIGILMKFKNLKIQDGGGRHLENPKIVISRQRLTDCNEIWHGDAVWHSWCVQKLKICNFKNQDGGGRHFKQSKNRHIIILDCQLYETFKRITIQVNYSWPSCNYRLCTLLTSIIIKGGWHYKLRAVADTQTSRRFYRRQ